MKPRPIVSDIVALVINIRLFLLVPKLQFNQKMLHPEFLTFFVEEPTSCLKIHRQLRYRTVFHNISHASYMQTQLRWIEKQKKKKLE